MRLGIVSGVVGANHGQGRVNLEIAREAVRRGHTVVIIAEEVDASASASGARCVVLPPPGWLPGRLLRDQLFAWRSRAALRRERLDAVLANGFVTWGACQVNAVHFVHASWVRSDHHPWRVRRGARSLYAYGYSWLNVALERIAFARARRLVAVSGSVARDLERHGASGRVTVVPNGVDVAQFRPGAVDRIALGLPDGVALAVFAGDLNSARKNLDGVLKVVAAVPALHVAVAGGGDARAHVELGRRLGIGARLHWLGFRTDMPAIMRAADLVIFPSRYEPCGLVLLEALASGVPVVTSRNVGGSELIGPEVGIVVEDCDDVDALSHAVGSLLGDGAARAAMGVRARALAETLSWSGTAGRYVDLMVQAAHG